MKRDLLKKLGLNDEDIDKIMAENGKDIEAVKGDIEKTKEDLAAEKKRAESTIKQLETANKTIESYKSMDIETIKQDAEEYKQKFEKAQKQAKEDIEALKFDYSVESALNKAGAKNSKAARALLDIETLQKSKNVDSDVKDAIDELKESDGYLFEKEPNPQGTGGSLGNTEKNGDGDTEPVTKEQFGQMGYIERLKLKQDDAELYKKLNE